MESSSAAEPPDDDVVAAAAWAGHVGGAKRPSFRSVDEYLALAQTDPFLLRSPYRREDRRVLAYLHWLRGRLPRLALDTGRATPVVSIVLPLGAESGGVRRTILSVVAQSMRRWELLLVGDDRSGAAGGVADPRIRQVPLAAPATLGAATNTAIEAARGRYVAHLRAGDWWHPDFLGVLLRRAEESGHALMYSAVRVLGPTSLARRYARRPEAIQFVPNNPALLENRETVGRSALVHSREVAIRHGGFDETLSDHAQWEFLVRVSGISPPVGVPAVLAHSPMNGQAAPRGEGSPSPTTAAGGGPPATSTRRPLDLRPPAPEDASSSVLGRLPELRGLASPATRTPGDRRVTIVIPSFGVPEVLRLCVEGVHRFTPAGSFDLVIVDNGSNTAVQEVLDAVETSPSTTVIRNPDNRGFTHAVGQGFAASAPDTDVVILNNDAIVTPGWLAALQRVATLHPDAGLVAPRQVLLAGSALIERHVPGADPTNECDTNLSALHRNVVDPYFDTQHAITELRFAPFFCVLVRREAIDRCGPLDARMGAHYQSDWVYCAAVRHHAGMRILHTPHAKVYHFQGLATQELRDTAPEEFRALTVVDDWRRVERRARAGSSDPSPGTAPG